MLNRKQINTQDEITSQNQNAKFRAKIIKYQIILRDFCHVIISKLSRMIMGVSRNPTGNVHKSQIHTRPFPVNPAIRLDKCLYCCCR